MAYVNGYGYGGSPYWQFIDANGNPLSNGTVSTYIAGTTTAYNTLKDWNSTYNGVVFDLDIRGGCSMIWPTTQLIKIIVKDVDGNPFKTLDNIGSGTAEYPITVFPDVSDNQNIWYLDTVNGLDTNSGRSRSAPKKTGDAVVIACKTAGKSAGRLVVMAGINGIGVEGNSISFTASNWSSAKFPFDDVFFENSFTTVEWTGVESNNLFGGEFFYIKGSVSTFNNCNFGSDCIIEANNLVFNGGHWIGPNRISAEKKVLINGLTFAGYGSLDLSAQEIEISSYFNVAGSAKISTNKIYGAGSFGTYADTEVYLELEANVFSLEGQFQFPSQSVNSSIKITAAKMQRTATTRLLYLGAVANVTVNYQIIVDTMGSIVPMEIANPSGTVAGKVIELLKYENKVDAEIVRATAAEALKANKLTTVNNSTSTAYIFVAADVLTSHVVNSATAATRTVPSDATAPTISIGDSIEIVQLGAGQVTLVADTNVTILTSLTLKTYGQNSVIAIRKTAANTWLCMGERAVV